MKRKLLWLELIKKRQEEEHKTHDDLLMMNMHPNSQKLTG